MTHKEASMSAVRTAILLVLAGVAAPVFAEQITCESRNERTEACTTLQPGSSVRMVQQISNSPCIEGQTWGADQGSIWVSQGCRAVFDIDYHRAAYDDRDRGDRDDRRVAMEEHNRHRAKHACVEQAASSGGFGPDDVRADDVRWIGEGQFVVDMNTPNGDMRCTVDREGNVLSLHHRR
jgi:hypothetical protein